MRWWICLILFLLAAGMTVSFLHTKHHTVGEKLLDAMQKETLPLRPAIEAWDFSPDENAIAQLAKQYLQRGQGAPPGTGNEFPFGQQWIKSENVQFTWNLARNTDASPLRAALMEESPIRVEMARVVVRAGYFRDTAMTAMRDAVAELNVMTDEELLQAWLRADQAVLAERDDLKLALREALAMIAREGEGPIVMFSRSGMHIYLIPAGLENGEAWCSVEAYDKSEKCAWTGMLRVGGNAGPEQVRNIAVWMIDAMAKPIAPPPGATWRSMNPSPAAQAHPTPAPMAQT